MNATKAKELLSLVPASDFIAGEFTNGKNKCCAIGHLYRLSSGDPKNYALHNCVELTSRSPITKFVREQVNTFLIKFHDVQIHEDTRLEYIGGLAWINNSNEYNGYTEVSIKDRVMHLLDDMIEQGY